MFLEQGDVRAVDEQVGAKLEEMHLLLNFSPEVNARADVVGTRLSEYCLAGAQKLVMFPLLRHTETAREIVRSYEHGIEIRHCEDFIQRLNGGNTFDIDDEQVVLRVIVHVGLQFRLNLGTLEHLLELLPLDGPQFHRAAQGLHLPQRFHVRCDDARVEDEGPA